MTKRFLPLATAAVLLLVSGISSSQAYPARPLRLIVPSAPGGSPDINARELYSKLSYDFARDFQPELPTLDEAGLPGYELGGWSGFAVPKGVPREIVLRLNAEINKALASTAVVKRTNRCGNRVTRIQTHT